MNKVTRWLLKSFLPPFGVFCTFIALWYAVRAVLPDNRKILLAAPHQIFTEALSDEKVRSDILSATWTTLEAALIGLGVAIVIGLTMAVLMSQAKWIERSFYPWAIFLQTVPILALVPLIGMWFGFELFARVVVCAIIAMFPMIINPLNGFLSADRGLHDLFTLAGTSKATRMAKLLGPSALPDIFVGLQTAAGLAVVGATVGDFFFGRGPRGLGLLINFYRSRVQTAELFATILATCLLGLVIFWFFGALGRRVVGKWSPAWGAPR
ncbi:ABC transporter permease [Nocardioides sp. YIM 152588]|uniref:ABC transporter permease n=1 Tax=Nocardioides sp. YIM 152588 TaxID=3158259 RepID=UPI0032E37E55